MSPIESALMVLVPEAERLVKPFRDRYDPSAAAGVPAHITLLYPFKHPDEVDQPVLEDLNQCFDGCAPFRFSLAPIRRFPAAVLYLAPEPDEPFRKLTLAIWDRYPETPPYGGKWADILPPLSGAWLVGGQPPDPLTREFVWGSPGDLPLLANAAEVALLDEPCWHLPGPAVVTLGG